MNDSSLALNCPTCKAVVYWTDEFPYRPFCSQRCKTIDFGDWAMERHSIPGEPAFLSDDETPQES